MKNSLKKLFEGFFGGVAISVLLSPVWMLFFAVLCDLGNITNDILGVSDGGVFGIGVIVGGLCGTIAKWKRAEDDSNSGPQPQCKQCRQAGRLK